MHQLFRSHHGCLYPGLRNYYKSRTVLLLMSKLHSSPKILSNNSKLDFVFDEVEALNSSKLTNQTPQKSSNIIGQSNHAKGNAFAIHVSHPWPEWVDLMELLFKRGYFEASGNLYLTGELGTKETNWIRTACLNFARDQSGLIR